MGSSMFSDNGSLKTRKAVLWESSLQQALLRPVRARALARGGQKGLGLYLGHTSDQGPGELNA